jgi:hypothetical protein
MKISITVTTISLLVLGTAAMADNRATQILTESMASGVLGCPVQASQDNAFPDTEIGKVWVSNAHYSEKGGAKRTIGILIRHAGSPEEAQNTFAQSKQLYHGVDVAGIGDKAYRTDKPAQLNVLKGQNWLIINCGPVGGADPGGQEKLAKELLPNLTF